MLQGGHERLTDRQTDRQTDGLTDTVNPLYPAPLPTHTYTHTNFVAGGTITIIKMQMKIPWYGDLQKKKKKKVGQPTLTVDAETEHMASHIIFKRTL